MPAIAPAVMPAAAAPRRAFGADAGSLPPLIAPPAALGVVDPDTPEAGAAVLVVSASSARRASRSRRWPSGVCSAGSAPPRAFCWATCVASWASRRRLCSLSIARSPGRCTTPSVVKASACRPAAARVTEPPRRSGTTVGATCPVEAIARRTSSLSACDVAGVAIAARVSRGLRALVFACAFMPAGLSVLMSSVSE